MHANQPRRRSIRIHIEALPNPKDLIDQIKNVLIHEHIIWNIIQPNNNILQNPINLENRWQTNYETDLNAENSHQEDM